MDEESWSSSEENTDWDEENTEKSDLTISGYIREHQWSLFGDLCQTNPYYNIPELVSKICLVLYHEDPARWDPELCHENVEIQGNIARNTVHALSRIHGQFNPV